jgi:hypothetical protein
LYDSLFCCAHPAFLFHLFPLSLSPTFQNVIFHFQHWIAFLADTQPLFIKGVRVKPSSSTKTTKHAYILASTLSQTARNTAFAYFVVLIISLLLGWNLCWRIRAYQRRLQYSDIPDEDHHSTTSSLLPTFHQHASSEAAGALPTIRRRRKHHHHSNGGGILSKIGEWTQSSRPAKPKRK